MSFQCAKLEKSYEFMNEYYFFTLILHVKEERIYKWQERKQSKRAKSQTLDFVR